VLRNIEIAAARSASCLDEPAGQALMSKSKPVKRLPTSRQCVAVEDEAVPAGGAPSGRRPVCSRWWKGDSDHANKKRLPVYRKRDV